MAQKVQENVNMEQFDIERFNQNKDGYTWSYTLSNGIKIRELESHGDGYRVETVLPNSAYTRRKLFNYDGYLIAENLQFFNFFIGAAKTYDGKGHLIKEQNQDEGFDFSLDQLIKKMADDYGIDITDTRQTFRVNRWIDELDGKPFPVYDVYVYRFKDKHTGTTQTTAYLFDGTTGKLLHSIISGLEGYPDVWSSYQATREK